MTTGVGSAQSEPRSDRLRLAGTIDFDNVQMLLDEAKIWLTNSVNNFLTVDFSGIRSTSAGAASSNSAVVAFMMAIFSEAQKYGKHIKWIGVADNLRSIMHLSGLDWLMEI